MLVGIRSPRGGRWDTCRIPDVTVLSIEQWEAMQAELKLSVEQVLAGKF